MEDTLTIPEQTQTEQQPTPPSKKLYDNLVGEKLYTKSYDEFVKQFSNSESIKKLHTALSQEQLYTKGEDSFSQQFFPEVKKKADSSVGATPSVNGSSDIPKVKEPKPSLADFGILPSVIPQSQQVNQPVSTQTVQPKVTATYDDFRDHNAERKEKKAKLVDEAIDNTARKILKNKGIVKPDEEGKALNLSQFQQLTKEKKRLQEDFANGDATFGISKQGEVGLNRTTGWWEALKKGWNESMQGNDEAAEFAGADAAGKVAFINRKQEEKPVNEHPEYIGERGSDLSSVTGLVGQNAPFLVKAGEGAALGTALTLAAPFTGGTTLAGLPAATAFIFTANDAKNQGIQAEVTRRFYKLKQQNPEADDVTLMKQAEDGALVGGLAGIATNAALMTSVKAPLTFEGKSVVGKAIAKAIGTSVYAGGATAGIEGAKLAEGNLEGIKTTPTEIAKEMGKTFSETATTLGILHVLTGAATGIFKLPKMVNSAMKYALKDADPQQLSATLKANEQAGKIPEGAADKVMEEIESYKAALGKTVEGLPPEAEASVAGLIEQKTKLIEEQKTKDSSAKPYYDERIAGIDEQIQKTLNTGKPYAHEIDEISGDKYTAPKAETAEPQGKSENILTKDAEDLLSSVSNGSMPTFITKNLERVANENGVEITGEMSANDVVNALKEKKKSGDNPSTQQSALSRAKDLVNSGVVKGFTADILKDAANNNEGEFKSHLKDIAEQSQDPRSEKQTVETYGKDLVGIANELNPKENGGTTDKASEPIQPNEQGEKQQGIKEEVPTSTESDSGTGTAATTPVYNESGVVTIPPDKFNEPTLIGTNEEAQTTKVSDTQESSGQPKEVVNTPIGETGGGGKEPPKVTPIEGDGKGDDWTAIRKEKQREIKAVKESYEKQGVKAWSETLRKGLEKVQNLHPQKTLYDAALTTMYNIKSGLGHGDLTTDEALGTMQYLKRELGQKRSQIAEAVTSDNELVRKAALMQDEALGRDYENTALAIKDITTTAGRTLNYAQSEMRLDPENGLQIRRMQLLRAKGGEKLTPEEMKWTEEKWNQERDLMRKEAEVREQSMKEDFDNQIAELQRQHEQRLKDAAKDTPQNKAKKAKTLSEKGKDIADKIRKLKTNKKDLNLDVTFGLRNLAIEAVAQLVEKGATIADAIKEVLKDVKYKGISENELSNHIVDGLNNKKDKAEQLDKISEFAKENGDTEISGDMVTKNLIRDYVNSHVGEVDKSEVFETAFNDLKKVLPDVTKEKLVEAYLKEGEFKQPTKKQLEGGIREQENELKKIAKTERTADQQQKVKLDSEKANALKKIKDFKRKLADKEFEEPVPVKLKKQDAELIKIKKQQSVIEEAYRKEEKKFSEQHKTKTERLADFARSAYVAILIGAPKTLAKVASMSILRPFSEATTKLTLGKVFDKFFPNISQAATRGGESSSLSSVKKGFEAYFRQMGDEKMESMYDKASSRYEEAKIAYNDYKDTPNTDPKKLESLKNEMNDKLIKAQGSFIYKFIGGSSLKDALNSLVNRSNEIEKQFGKVEGESIKDGNWLDKTNYIMGFIGRSHSAAKTFSGRFSFAAGFMARLEGAVKNGEDISSPDKVLEIAHESYLDWERGKYQQSNQISDLWNKLTNNISEGEKGTPREGTAKAMAALLKTEVAITRVPVNILHEAVMEYTLGAFRAVAMIAKANKGFRAELKGEGMVADSPEFKAALRERISQMDEKQAATIARAFRKGGLGVGLYALALMTGAIHFGIFPHLGQKKKKEEADLKPDELNPGQVMVGNNKLGETASGIIEHIPALWTTFMGLGMATAYKDQIDKGKSSKEAVAQAIYTHLKVIEGSIPQSKIISPSRVGETILQTVKKKATDAGVIVKDEFQGFSKQQLQSDGLKYVIENKVKLAPPQKKYKSGGVDKIMTDEEFEAYTKNRATRIEHDLNILKANGTNSGKTDKESIQKAVEFIERRATKHAKSEVIKKSDEETDEPTGIRNDRPLPVRPLR